MRSSIVQRTIISHQSIENPVATERIQKILAKAGIASRREAERMVLEGRVTVNGRVIDTLGLKTDPLKDAIKVDGKRLTGFEPPMTLLLNKPRGYLATVKDPKGRPTVMDLLKHLKLRIYPVGRLDLDAEGLLLLTNDGELANRLAHPKFSIPRTYLVKVVTEGRNRLVKRMFSAIGHPVLKLKRIQFGPIQLGGLPFGQFRHLTAEEIAKLKSIQSKSSDNRPLPPLVKGGCLPAGRQGGICKGFE